MCNEEKLPVWEEVKLAPKGAKPECFGCPYVNTIKKLQKDTAQIKKKVNQIAKSNN